MLNVVLLSVANKPFMLSVIMLNVIMLSVIMPNVVVPNCMLQKLGNEEKLSVTLQQFLQALITIQKFWSLTLKRENFLNNFLGNFLGNFMSKTSSSNCAMKANSILEIQSEIHLISFQLSIP